MTDHKTGTREEWLAARLELLEAEKDKWARLMTREMGKTYKAAVAEAEKCASACRYFAENGERFLADEAVETDADKSYVRYLPLGPVLGVHGGPGVVGIGILLAG